MAWRQRMFSDKNQAEIGAMLGKSSDWVSIRARIHKLPDELKERLRQRPRAISQMLELSVFYARQPDTAVEIAFGWAPLVIGRDLHRDCYRLIRAASD